MSLVPRNSMDRYNADVEWHLKLLAAGVSNEQIDQLTQMRTAQRSDVGGDWVVMYVRDCETADLLHTFQVKHSLSGDERKLWIAREMERLYKLYPRQANRMVVCHE